MSAIARDILEFGHNDGHVAAGRNVRYFSVTELGPPLPSALLANTVNVYAVDCFSLLKVTEAVVGPTVVVMPPGDTVTVYEVIGLPPL